MKWKRVLIWTTVCALLGAGGVVGVRHLTSRQRKTANVVPVANVDQILMFQAWGDMYEMSGEQMYGSIVSRNTQTVDLEIGDGKTLRTVNVETCDNVKTGDVLLQYNVDKKELEREAHDLDLQLAQLQLRRLENELEEIRRKNPSLFVDLEERLKTTTSADVVVDEDSGADSTAADQDTTKKETETAKISTGKTSTASAAGDLLAEDSLLGEDSLLEEGENLLLDEEEMTEEDELTVLPDGILGKTSRNDLLTDGVLSDSEDPDADGLQDGILTDDEEREQSSADNPADGSFLSGIVGEILTDSPQSLILDSVPGQDTLQSSGNTNDVIAGDTDGVLADDPVAEDKAAADNSISGDGAIADGFGEGITDETEGLISDNADAAGGVIADNADAEDAELTDGIGQENEVTADPQTGEEIVNESSNDGNDGSELFVDAGLDDEEEEAPENEADLIASDDESSENDNVLMEGLPDDGEAEDSEDDLYMLDEAEEAESDAEELNLPEADNSLSESYAGSGSVGTTDIGAEYLDIQNYLKTFLSLANLLTQQFTSGTDQLMPDDLEQARSIYVRRLAREATVNEFTDAFGETRSVALYLPSRKTITALKEMEAAYSDFSAADTLRALHQAYANYLYYRICWEIYSLETTAGTSVEEWTQETAERYEGSIRDLTDAWYELYFFWRYLKETLPQLAQSDSVYTPMPDIYLDELKLCLLSFVTADGDPSISDADFAAYPILGGAYSGPISLLVNLVNNNNMIEDETEKLDAEDETEDDEDDYEDDEEEGDEAETPEELRDAFFAKMMDIRAQRLNVREAELKLKQDDEEIEKATVRATINGVVRSAGTLEEGKSSEEAFVVVSGEKGMYACGSISELERDNIQIGDTLTGMSEDTGVSFTATVTEISDYPASSSDDFFFYNYSSELTNSNASDYPFYAYIEDAEGLEEGSATMQFDKKRTDAAVGVLLESYFVVDENGGRHYVLVAGEKGLLEKRYVTIGTNPYGYGSMITEGLSDDDLIAFPYENGNLRQEGESVREVDSLDEEIY